MHTICAKFHLQWEHVPYHPNTYNTETEIPQHLAANKLQLSIPHMYKCICVWFCEDHIAYFSIYVFSTHMLLLFVFTWDFANCFTARVRQDARKWSTRTPQQQHSKHLALWCAVCSLHIHPSIWFIFVFREHRTGYFGQSYAVLQQTIAKESANCWELMIGWPSAWLDFKYSSEKKG